MVEFFHWLGLALGAIVIAGGFYGFWRGLALRSENPESGSPERT